VALARIQDFLLAEEITESSLIPAARRGEMAVIVPQSDFSWEGANDAAGDVATAPPLLEKLQLVVPAGQLLGIIGGTGEGKSSLLAAILGEMTCLSAQTDNPVTIRGRVAYVQPLPRVPAVDARLPSLPPSPSPLPLQPLPS